MFAPSPKHLRTSVPRMTPPSMYTSTLGLIAFTALDIDFKTEIVDGNASIFLPPELETQIASAPFYTAIKPSSEHMTPWTITGFPPASSFTFLISLRVQYLEGINALTSDTRESILAGCEKSSTTPMMSEFY